MGKLLNVIHTKDGIKTFSDDDLINNALEQEKQGIKPHMAWYDYKTKEQVTPAGWLVVSTWIDGAYVVYRRNDGKMIINHGWQSDFAMV